MWRKKTIINTWDKYNRLTIIKEVENKWKIRYFECQCDCGNITIVALNNFYKWNTKSCWCLVKETNKILYTKHQMIWSKIYWVWAQIKVRCDNIKHKRYKDYWWRWIAYDSKWKNFEEFYKDMWDSYEEWLSIDRIDNDWNYCKENCKWSTSKEQANNRRNNIT